MTAYVIQHHDGATAQKGNSTSGPVVIGPSGGAAVIIGFVLPAAWRDW